MKTFQVPVSLLINTNTAATSDGRAICRLSSSQMKTIARRMILFVVSLSIFLFLYSLPV